LSFAQGRGFRAANQGETLYLDCFHRGAALGKKFPLSTYGPGTLAEIMEVISKVAKSFTAFSITPEPLGRSPVALDSFWRSQAK